MSHNINVNKGKASIFVVKEPAWHRLGTVVENAVKSIDAIKLAHLDYKVDIKPAEINIGGIYHPVPNAHATYRTDTNDVFGIVGNQYTIVQNKEAFDFIDDIIGSKEAIFHTAGALGKGEVVFISVKLPNGFKVKGYERESVDNYLLLSMSHDGSSSINVYFTPIRVVCNNTLNLAIDTGRKIATFRHTRNVKDKLNRVALMLRSANDKINKYQQIFSILAEVKFDDYTIGKIITKSIDYKGLALFNEEHGNIDISKLSTKAVNKINTMFDIYDNAIGQDTELTRGTAYGLYNAFSFYANNVANYKDETYRFNKTLLDTGYMDKAEKLIINELATNHQIEYTEINEILNLQ